MEKTFTDWPTVPNAETQFAPAAREGLRRIRQQAGTVQGAQIAQAILEAIPDVAMVLNDKRQIVAANREMLDLVGSATLEGVLGMRPGEAIRCIHASSTPGGCGTGEACRQCGATKAMLTALLGEKTVEREAQITVRTADRVAPLELLVRARFLRVDGTQFLVLVMKDLSGQKRKEAAERIVFDGVLTTLTSLSEILVERGEAARKECRPQRSGQCVLLPSCASTET